MADKNIWNTWIVILQKQTFCTEYFLLMDLKEETYVHTFKLFYSCNLKTKTFIYFNSVSMLYEMLKC